MYLNEIVSRHGIPLSIVSARDSRFVSNFWKSLQQNLGTRVNLSAAYHPQTDGQNDRTIQTLEDMLLACVMEYGGSWDTHLPKVVNDQTVVLDLPQKLLGIHDTFNMCYLCKCKVDDESQILQLQDLKVDMNKKLVEEPVKLLDRKVTKLRKKQIPMVLVEWRHSLGSNLTWETEQLMKCRYPRLFDNDQIPRTESS
ncbi:uncharacterized protein [Rutidosis leptorrhynchoides]|uniref:uncharacterized protein n=1 Tax=Rutidosis leptorrhynchoides TaxID=125765 RepID=UPI003A99D560